MNFADRLIKEIMEKKSYLCVGLDPQLKYIPQHILSWAYNEYGEGYRATAEAFISFNMAIINATFPFAATYKLQMAFYEKYGSEGVRALEVTVDCLSSLGLEAIIEDAKREDGGDTADAYADGHMGEVDVIGKNGKIEMMRSPFDFDAITITPWICEPNFSSFLRVAEDSGKGFFVVDLTSFKPNSFLQEMIDQETGKPAWQVLAERVREIGEPLKGDHGYSSVGVVLGATQGSDDAETMKRIIPKAFKLIPGFGFQQGGPDDAVAAVNSDGLGIIVNNSRAVSCASHPRVRAKMGITTQCDPRNFAEESRSAAKKAQDSLNAAVLNRNKFLPWD